MNAEQLTVHERALLLTAAMLRVQASADNTPVHKAADAHLDAMQLAVMYAFLKGRKAYKSSGAKAAVKAVHDGLLVSLPPVLLKALAAGGDVALKKVRGKARAAGDQPGHEFHGNQWTSTEPAMGEPGSKERMQHVAWEHGKTWRDKAAKLEVIKKKDAKNVNWSRDWEADTRVRSVAQAQDEIDHFKDREQKAHATARSLTMRTLKPQRPGQPHSDEPPFRLQFNAKDESAIAWAQDHAAELAEGLSKTSRDDIKSAVAAALEGDGIESSYDDILDAVGDEDRAAMIARTETMWAANEGQQQGWEQAAEAGLLDEDQQVVWIATSGCCDDCDDMDGETRPLNGEYDDPDYADGPPAHPNCRCTEGIA